MIIAIALWLGAHVGVVTATPAVVNVLAVGSLAENARSYYDGKKDQFIESRRP